MASIKQLFFDFGGVLVNLDFNGAIEAFRKLGATAESFYSEKFHKMLLDFENGKTEENDFFEQLRTFLGITSSDEKIRQCWNIVIQTIPAYKLDILRTLKKTFPIYMVSNTNITHIEYTKAHLFKENGLCINDYFDKLYFSYEIGASKPDMKFYNDVIADAKINPAESLFIDDKEENIDGARRAGFQVCRVCQGENLGEKIFPFLNKFSV